MFTLSGLKFWILSFSFYVLLPYALYHILGSKSDLEKLRREHAAGPETEREAQRILRRTRRMYLVWVVFVAAHRLAVFYWGMIAGLGLLVCFADPWGSLPSLLLYKAYTQYAGIVWADGGFAKFYAVASVLLDALILFVLWLLSRHAFAVEEGSAAESE